MIRICLLPTGNAISFPDDDDGTRIDLIEEALARKAGFKRTRKWSTPLEDIRLLTGGFGDLLLRWDGYFTELVRAKGNRSSLLDVFASLEDSDGFTATRD